MFSNRRLVTYVSEMEKIGEGSSHWKSLKYLSIFREFVVNVRKKKNNTWPVQVYSHTLNEWWLIWKRLFMSIEHISRICKALKTRCLQFYLFVNKKITCITLQRQNRFCSRNIHTCGSDYNVCIHIFQFRPTPVRN
jgi:hypothetical protein